MKVTGCLISSVFKESNSTYNMSNLNRKPRIYLYVDRVLFDLNYSHNKCQCFWSCFSIMEAEGPKHLNRRHSHAIKTKISLVSEGKFSLVQPERR